jgi:hypothetical protein
MILLVVQILVVNAFSSDSIFSQFIIKENSIFDTYKEIVHDYYSSFNKLLNVDFVTRKDGTPNFIVDTDNNVITFRLKLTVNDKEYNRWKKSALKKFKEMDLEREFSKDEQPMLFYIAGEVFNIGEHEANVILRINDQNSFLVRAGSYIIQVEYINKLGEVVDKQNVPLTGFKRMSHVMYPLPLYHLNRLTDLPKSMEYGDVEASFYTIHRANSTIQWMETVVDIRCRIMTIEEADEYSKEIRKANYEKTKIVYNERSEKRKIAISKMMSNFVKIPHRDYMMGKYEVTQDIWAAVMNFNPSRFVGDNQPVERVSFTQCMDFIGKLNSLPEVENSGLVFRLPTAEEWEHACRAGSVGEYGLIEENLEGTPNEMCWSKDSNILRAQPVGQKKPNMWGLYDMHGNVWEWTSTNDEYKKKRCGGSWYDRDYECSATRIHSDPPSFSNDTMGLRLVAEPLGKNLDKPEE